MGTTRLYIFVLIGAPLIALMASFSRDLGIGVYLNAIALSFLTVATGLTLFSRFSSEGLRAVMAAVWLIAAGAYFVLYSKADWGHFQDQFLNFAVMKGRYHLFIAPLVLIANIALWSCILSTLIGLFLALLRGTNNVFIVGFVTSYVVFFRAIPVLVLVILVYYALPYVGIELVSTVSVVVSLSMLFGAYTTEIFRSGIESIHRIQIDAAKSLGLTPFQTTRWIVLPQALRVVIPPLTNILIDVLKTTSIAYVVGVPELIARAQQMQALVGSVTPLIYASFLYGIIVLPLVIVSSRMEKHSRRWSGVKAS